MRKLTLSLMAAALLAGCAGQEKKAEISSLNNDDLYEVHHDGRIYIFDDLAGYRDFLDTGEVAYRLTRIGAGPQGQTVVFGLSSEDKKKTSGIAGIDLFDKKLAAADSFYGEMQMEGRIYVFDSYELMDEVRQMNGHVAYRYTDIGAGPQGETVVYALTDAQKKSRPDQLIERFKARKSH